MDELLSRYPFLLDIQSLSEILDISPNTIRKLIRQKELPYIKIGNIIRIPRDQLIIYLEKNSKKED